MSTTPYMKCSEGIYCDKKATWEIQEKPPKIVRVEDDPRHSTFSCDGHVASVLEGFHEYYGLGAVLIWPYTIGE